MSKPKLELKLRNTTPLLVGWYDPHKQDRMGIRVTEIKGIWRWWCRAFIAGAMYDMNLLSGRNDKDIYLIPTNKEAKAISCFVGKILGLGYAGEKGAESSRFKLYIKTDSSLESKEFREDKTEYQKRELHTLKNSVKGIKPGNTFTLSVEKVREKYRDAENLALKILLVSLQLSGIGKGARKGSGSLDIISIPHVINLKFDDIIPPSISKNDNKVHYDIGRFINHIYNESINIVKNYQKICRIESNKQDSSKPLPPLPVVSKNAFKLYKVNAKDNQSFIDYLRLFLVGAALREKRKAWFLGLPRKQKGAYFGCGNKKSLKSVRRPSPIFTTYHKEDNIFGSGVFVSIFLSGDWPRKLKWIGDAGQSGIINIDDNEIRGAYNIFYREFNEYLNQKGLTMQEIKWY